MRQRVRSMKINISEHSFIIEACAYLWVKTELASASYRWVSFSLKSMNIYVWRTLVKNYIEECVCFWEIKSYLYSGSEVQVAI